MNRCASLLLFAAASLSGASAWLPAQAQVVSPRNFSATVLRGELVVTQPPEVLVNRQPARLAPGSRLRGADNRLLMSGEVVGQPMLVHYTLDHMGQLLDVWVLTPAELARRPWPSTPEQASSWIFNADAQSWSRK